MSVVETKPGEKPHWSGLALGRKRAGLRDIQRIEQVGEIHVLEAKVTLGNATEEEKRSYRVKKYEMFYLDLKDLVDKDANQKLSLLQSEDMVYLNDYLVQYAEQYTEDLQWLKDHSGN